MHQVYRSRTTHDSYTGVRRAPFADLQPGMGRDGEVRDGRTQKGVCPFSRIAVTANS